MAHAPGWTELYEILERGDPPPPNLVECCRNNRNVAGETMLHWYAIEGAADILQKLVDLGYDVDACDDGDTPPIVHAAMTGRWDNVRVLRRAGARTRGVTRCRFSYRGLVSEAGDNVPEDLRGDAYQLEELLDPQLPEDVDYYRLQIIGVADTGEASGVPLSQENWDRYVAAHPEAGDLSVDFSEADGINPQPYLDFYKPDLQQRRQVYAIAKHFASRLRWWF